ncbi:unnamed protein product [Citrullus colocynthis]|uniref:Uncharacterized protein n=1 Tax=Citrullus colocynthis TaxID=252529 RepID=A0ABP0YWU5_9ROSI
MRACFSKLQSKNLSPTIELLSFLPCFFQKHMVTFVLMNHRTKPWNHLASSIRK